MLVVHWGYLYLIIDWGKYMDKGYWVSLQLAGSAHCLRIRVTFSDVLLSLVAVAAMALVGSVY